MLTTIMTANRKKNKEKLKVVHNAINNKQKAGRKQKENWKKIHEIRVINSDFKLL